MRCRRAPDRKNRTGLEISHHLWSIFRCICNLCFWYDVRLGTGMQFNLHVCVIHFECPRSILFSHFVFCHRIYMELLHPLDWLCSFLRYDFFSIEHDGYFCDSCFMFYYILPHIACFEICKTCINLRVSTLFMDSCSLQLSLSSSFACTFTVLVAQYSFNAFSRSRFSSLNSLSLRP